MSSTIRAGFHLYGETLQPTEITKATGVTPTSIARKGEPIAAGRRLIAKASSWALEVEYADALDVADVLEGLLGALRPAWEQFTQFAQQFEATVSLTVGPEVVMPAIYISPRLLAALCELGAGLDVAVHVDVQPGAG